MSFYVVYAKNNLRKLCVIKSNTESQVEAAGFIRASRKTWGLRRNANWYANQLAEVHNIPGIVDKIGNWPLD
jgi:hypothetical protein